MWGYSSAGRAPEWHSGGQRFEPDNLDAARMLAEVNAKNPGDFWGVLETRPYMRLRHSYLELLIQCGMMGKAVNEAEELLRLCEGDNLGIRYALMQILKPVCSISAVWPKQTRTQRSSCG